MQLVHTTYNSSSLATVVVSNAMFPTWMTKVSRAHNEGMLKCCYSSFNQPYKLKASLSMTSLAGVAIFVCLLATISHAQSSITCTDQCRNHIVTQDIIECQDRGSCKRSTLTSNEGYPVGTIDCSGQSSCEFAKSITSAYNLFCSGSHSCFDSGPIDSVNTYCTGSTSCSVYNSRPENGVISANRNLYCYGSNSCSSRIIDLGRRGFCAAKSACIDTTIKGGTYFKYIDSYE